MNYYKGALGIKLNWEMAKGLVERWIGFASCHPGGSCIWGPDT